MGFEPHDFFSATQCLEGGRVFRKKIIFNLRNVFMFQ